MLGRMRDIFRKNRVTIFTPSGQTGYLIAAYYAVVNLHAYILLYLSYSFCPCSTRHIRTLLTLPSLQYYFLTLLSKFQTGFAKSLKIQN